jgi:hypothetical protein
MAEVLCVYREVKLIKETAAAAKKEPSDGVAIVSYDEKPGIQAIATTAPDLPPEPGVHATFARDHEYKRHGTVSLLAGIDLLTGRVHALVRDRHRSREFIEFLELIDAAYPAHNAIKLILDNHSAHISKETKAWLAQQPVVASNSRSRVLRHIRVASKQEFKDRITAVMDEFNRHPVVGTSSYRRQRPSAPSSGSTSNAARSVRALRLTEPPTRSDRTSVPTRDKEAASQRRWCWMENLEWQANQRG